MDSGVPAEVHIGHGKALVATRIGCNATGTAEL